MEIVMYKTCSKCKKNLPVASFGKLKKSTDGYRQRCKECRKEDDLKYKEKELKYNKKWRADNKELKAKLDNIYYEKNKEKILNYAKQWRKDNKELNSKFMRDWQEDNKDHVREYKRKWGANKLKTNKSYKIHDRFSTLMRNHMNKYIVNGKSGSSWVKFVDYDADDLIAHLGRMAFISGYEIDHIIPVSLYDFKKMGDDEFRKCWNLRNLRIIPKEDNIKKGDCLNMELIEGYDIVDLLPMRFSEV